MTRDLPPRVLTSCSRHGVHRGVSYPRELAKTRLDSLRTHRMRQGESLRSYAPLPQKIHKFSTATYHVGNTELTYLVSALVVDFAGAGAKCAPKSRERQPRTGPRY